jgi:hypothetical protein
MVIFLLLLEHFHGHPVMHITMVAIFSIDFSAHIVRRKVYKAG